MQNQNQNQIINWSELCPEILQEIADRLGTLPNAYNFREVCKNWRFSISSIPKNFTYFDPLFPHRFFAVDLDFFANLSRGTLHHIVPDAVLLLKPRKNVLEGSRPWVVTVEEFYRGKITVRFPLFRVRVKEGLPKGVCLNLSDFDVKLIARGFSLRAPEVEKNLEGNGGLGFRNKLVLYADPGAFEPKSVGDYTGVVWFDDGRVAWVRLSRSLDWGYLVCNGTSKFDDVVNFRGRVYVVDRKGRVYGVSYDLECAKGENCQHTLRMECVVSDSISMGYVTDNRKRLVVDSCGELYLVERVICSYKLQFKAYKVDEENGRLDEVVGIGDGRILFVGVDWCFFASTDDFPGCRGNCIIFSKDSFLSYDEGRFSRKFVNESFSRATDNELGMAVFHFEDGIFGPLSDFPAYYNLLWPPPAWFCSASSSS